VRNTYKLYKKTIVKVLDDVLGAVFGKDIKELFYAHLREFENIHEKNYEDNLELFIISIEDFFGSKATKAIEKHVTERLREYHEFNNVDKNISMTELISRLDTSTRRSMNLSKDNRETARNAQTPTRKAQLIDNRGKVNLTTSERGMPDHSNPLSYIDLLTITLTQHEKKLSLIIEKLERISDKLEKINQHQLFSEQSEKTKSI